LPALRAALPGRLFDAFGRLRPVLRTADLRW